MANVPAPVYESFEATTFRGDTMDVIEKANSIINSYRKQGYVLSLRQLYYQFVSRDLIANNDKEYKRLGDIVSDGAVADLLEADRLTTKASELLS